MAVMVYLVADMVTVVAVMVCGSNGIGRTSSKRSNQ